MSREMKDSGIEWIGEIPSDWDIVKVKRLFQIGRGRVIAQTELKDNAKYPVYSSQTKDDGCLGYIDTYDFSDTQLTWTTDGANAGSVFLREGRYNCTNVCGTLLPNAISTDIRYMLYNLRYISVFHKRADTNGFKIMNNEMANIEIVLPNLQVQKRISTYLHTKVSQIDTIIKKQTQLIEDYKIYKQSLITETVTKGLNPNVEMKDSGIEWIGMVPKHWEIGIVKRWMNKITDGAHISPDTENGIYDFVSVTDIKEEVINFEQALKTSQDSYEYLVRTGCKPIINDVLLSKDGTIGKSVVINQDYEFVVASSLIIFRPDNRICSEYLNYLFKSDIIQKQLEGYLKGTGLKRVSISNASKMIGVLPPREEQRLISIFLDEKISKVNNIIKQKQTLIKELETYKKSLIYECVTGKREIPTIPASIDELIHPAYQEIAITKEGANHNE